MEKKDEAMYIHSSVSILVNGTPTRQFKMGLRTQPEVFAILFLVQFGDRGFQCAYEQGINWSLGYVN